VTPEEAQKITDALMQNRLQVSQLQGHPRAMTKVYSLAEVQLTNGEVFGMMITAGPTLGQHLTKEMGSTGYLYLYNDDESLIVKADRIAAVKLTKMTSGGA